MKIYWMKKLFVKKNVLKMGNVIFCCVWLKILKMKDYFRLIKVCSGRKQFFNTNSKIFEFLNFDVNDIFRK